MGEPDGPLLHVRAAAWQVLKEVQETGTCGRASLAGLDHSLTVVDRASAWVSQTAPASPFLIALVEALDAHDDLYRIEVESALDAARDFLEEQGLVSP